MCEAGSIHGTVREVMCRSGLLSATLFFFALLGFSPSAEAYFEGAVTFVHGYNGREEGKPESFLVDVAVDGVCLVRRIAFRQSAPLKELTSGSYEVTVHHSDGQCGTAPLAKRRLAALNVDKNALAPRSVVLHPNDEGEVLLTDFVNDVLRPALFIRNLSSSILDTRVAIRSADGFSELQELTLYPQSTRMFSIEVDENTTIYLEAAAERGGVVEFKGGVELMGIHPVYIVGSKRHGLEAITEQFDRLYSPTDKVSLHFIHGYNGTEVGEESAYPVDVSVNGRCVATGIRFKSTSIIRVLPAGTFEITVYRSDGRCAKSAIQTIPLVVSADGINIEPTRTVILSHQESSRPKLSVVHNQAKYPQVSVRNFIDKPLELTLTATNPDGTTYLARAWVYPDTCAALGVDEDHLKQYSLTAADSLGASFPLHFQTQTRRTNVVYVVGSTKSGYVAIRDIFERNQPKYLTASVSQ